MDIITLIDLYALAAFICGFLFNELLRAIHA